MTTEQEFLGNEPDNPLFTRRGLLERSKPMAIIAIKRAALERMDNDQKLVDECNDVLDGYGVHSLEDEEAAEDGGRQ